MPQIKDHVKTKELEAISDTIDDNPTICERILQDLNKNIKTIADSTWQMINADLLGYAKKEKVGKGRQVRIDCTCVETHIHHPALSTSS